MRTKTRAFQILSIVLALSSPAIDTLNAGDSLRIGRVRRCLPSYRYGESAPAVVTIVDSAPAVPLTNVTLGGKKSLRIEEVTTNTVASGVTTITRQTKRVRLPNPIPTRALRFVIPEAVAAPVTMSQPAAVAYESGDFNFSCLLINSGGPQGAHSGNRCRIRIQVLRGLAEFPEARVALPMVQEIVREVYVSSNKPLPLHIQLENSPEITRNFSEMSHIRVYLECIHDR